MIAIDVYEVVRIAATLVRWDGLITAKHSPSGSFDEITPDDIHAMRGSVIAHRTATTPFDIIFESSAPATGPDDVQPYADAGVTWWLEAFWSPPNGPDAIRERIQAGPPRVESTGA